MCGINKAEYCIEPEMKFEMNAWWSFDDGIILQYSTVLLFLLCWTKDIAVQCNAVWYDGMWVLGTAIEVLSSGYQVIEPMCQT